MKRESIWRTSCRYNAAVNCGSSLQHQLTGGCIVILRTDKRPVRHLNGIGSVTVTVTAVVVCGELAMQS